MNTSTMTDAQQATTEVRVEMPQPYYSQEDVHQILEVAIAHQAEQAGQMELTREQLLEIADDLGINATELEVAERTWLLQRGEQRERQAFDRFRRQRFQQRLVRYLIVNGGLAAIAYLSTGSVLGVPLIMLFWGMFLALDAWNTFFQRGDRYEIAFQRWRRRKRLQRSLSGLVDRFLSR
ncbi:2TM domain-containing protein [Vacuolonema iberomarrocanum]|uniref:2TM domain-containing protein n=1 Tax=Vacuolonema iberomarrocanum TaxID=3454632 RepID=UPI0019E4DD3F|nr:2TM domain-containing protein [filamentous cyanobacterium LEGE 07170]